MNPTAEKQLNAAMDRIHYTQVEAENFAKRMPGAAKRWKEMAQGFANSDAWKKLIKDVVPAMDKLRSLVKQAVKDLDKLQDAGDKPYDYHDGREFRDRNRKLMVSADKLDREIGVVLLKLHGLLGGGMFPGQAEPAIKSTVTYLVGYGKRWNELKLAYNRI